MGDEYSEIKYILSGVPQGSVLGPLLFLLFVDDLPEGIKSIIKLFADDVKMIVNPFNNLVADLQLLELWEAQWCLKFNVDKCMVMQVGYFGYFGMFEESPQLSTSGSARLLVTIQSNKLLLLAAM